MDLEGVLREEPRYVPALGHSGVQCGLETPRIKEDRLDQGMKLQTVDIFLHILIHILFFFF